MSKRDFVYSMFCVVLLIGCDTENKRQLHAPVTPTPSLVSFVDSDYTRPYKYHGFDVESVSKILKIKPDSSGNFYIKKPKHEILLETTAGIVTYSEVSLLETTPCSQSIGFDPKVMLNAVAENIDKLVLKQVLINGYVFLQHNDKLKISITCEEDREPIKIKYFKDYGY